MPLDHYEYWSEPPPEPSPRLQRWAERIQAEGWRPNARIQRMGRDACSEFYDVYQWEYFYCILPLVKPELAQSCGYTYHRWDGQKWSEL
jgi:hypothetical protein